MLEKHIIKAWATRGGKYRIEIEIDDNAGPGLHYVTRRTRGLASGWYGPVSLDEAETYAQKAVDDAAQYDNIHFKEVKNDNAN